MTCGCDDYYGGGCDGVDGSGSATPTLVRGMHRIGSFPGGWITLAEAKQHCRVDISDDDGYITALIAVASEYVTSRTGLSTEGATWQGELISFPATASERIVLPLGPIATGSSGSISWTTTGGVAKSVLFNTALGYPVINGTASTPAIVTDPSNVDVSLQTWPDASDVGPAGIKIVWETDGSPDAMVKHAGLMLIANWYASREPVTAGLSATNMQVPYTLDILLGSSTQQVYFPK